MFVYSLDSLRSLWVMGNLSNCLHQTAQSAWLQVRMHMPDELDQMNNGRAMSVSQRRQEDLIKDHRTELFIGELLSQADESVDEVVQVLVLKGAAIVSRRETAKNASHRLAVLLSCHIGGVVDGQHGGQAVFSNVSAKGVGRWTRVLNDGQRRFAIIRRQTSVDRADLKKIS